jgi:uncharacterized protein (DUF427 family)
MADHVRVSPAARIRVVLDGETIVDTDRGYVVHEDGLPPRFYVPPDTVRAELSPTAQTGGCPRKGQWRHLDVTAGGKRVPSGAWAYDEVLPVTEPIKGFVCFYANKVDRILGEEGPAAGAGAGAAS